MNREDRLRGHEKVLLAVLVFAGFTCAWWIIAVSRIFDPYLFPGPFDVVATFAELARSGTLFEHMATSVFRVLAGFSLATIVAIPLGIIFGWYPRLGSAFSPLIEVLRTISPIAWIPLAILWFGIGDRPAIFIIFMAALFPILIATMQAPRQIDPLMIKAARNFGAGDRLLLRKVIVPASLPYIFVGLRIGLGIAWVVVVAAEMVGMRSGLGYMILDARNFLRTDMIIAGMLVIGVIGFSLDCIMRFFDRMLQRQRV